jgi:Domain of unknown function (DUF4350)
VRERLVTLGCALGALLVFAMLFVHTGAPGERDAPAPTTAERRGNGLLGVMTWLREEGIRTVSLRERLGTLAKQPGLTATGNLLVVILPATTAFRTDEAVALDTWVRAGNTLLILAALSDRPDWARSERGLAGDLQLLSGLEAQPPQEQADAEPANRPPSAQNTGAPAGTSGQSAAKETRSLVHLARESLALAEPKRSALVPNRPHVYVDGVKEAIALSDFPPQEWTVKVPRDGFMLSLAHQASSGEGVLWIRPLGAGTILVSGFASLFTNRALGLADNARLFANIVASATGPGGSVIFDDEHQGLSAAYDPAKFYKDRRLYATLTILAAVWLVWVLGGTQLQAPSVRIPAPQETQLVRDTGLFLARVLRPAAAARRMFENFLLDIRDVLHDGGKADDSALWDWLEQHPRLARADVVQLKSWYGAAHADQKVPLVRLRNLIVRTERLLTS